MVRFSFAVLFAFLTEEGRLRKERFLPPRRAGEVGAGAPGWHRLSVLRGVWGATARRRHAPPGCTPDSDLHTVARSRVCTPPPTAATWPGAPACAFSGATGGFQFLKTQRRSRRSLVQERRRWRKRPRGPAGRDEEGAPRPAPRAARSRGTAASHTMPRVGGTGRFSRPEGSREPLVARFWWWHRWGGARCTPDAPLFLRPATGPGASVPWGRL